MRLMLRRVGQIARILEQQHVTVGPIDVVLHRGDRGDEAQVELALQPLLDDLHVQQTEKAAAETEPERGGRLGLVVEAGVVEHQLLERVAQPLILVRVGRIDAGEHHRLDVAVAGQQRGRAVVRVEDGVAHPRVADTAQAGDHVAHLAGLELGRRMLAQPEVADLVHVVQVVRVGAEGDLHPLAHRAVHHPDARNRAPVAVVVRIEDERAERRLLAAPGRRHPGHDGFEQLGDAGALLGRDRQDLHRAWRRSGP